MILRLFAIELRKLNGSLAALLAFLAPALLGVLTLCASLSNHRSPKWQSLFGDFLFPIWALFLLPMAVTAFATLLAQIEHKSRAWDHLLALPVGRATLFSAKALVMVFGTMAMTVLMLVFATTGELIGATLTGRWPIDAFPLGGLFTGVALVLGSAGLLVALQLWVALRFTNFVVSLGFGIGGTLVAIAAAMAGTEKVAWFPWVLPLKLLMAPHPIHYAVGGAVAGTIVMLMMVIDLSRRGTP